MLLWLQHLARVAPKDPEKVPEAAFGDREPMGHWASHKIEKRELHSYQMGWNPNSLDGLTSLKGSRRDIVGGRYESQCRCWHRGRP